MSTQNEAHGDEDLQQEKFLQDALVEIIQVILESGGYPAQGRRRFDLYEFLDERRDPSFFLEMYVATMSSNNNALESRIDRERATVEQMLVEHLTGSEIVSELAAEYAAEDK